MEHTSNLEKISTAIHAPDLSYLALGPVLEDRVSNRERPDVAVDFTCSQNRSQYNLSAEVSLLMGLLRAILASQGGSNEGLPLNNSPVRGLPSLAFAGATVSG